MACFRDDGPNQNSTENPLLLQNDKGESHQETTRMTSNNETNGQEYADELLTLARKHWLVEEKKKRPKFNGKVVDQIFQGLNERSFPLRELLVLDQTMYLER